MSTDISAGDSTPALSQASITQAAIAINRWFKYVEVSDVAATPLVFNKQVRTTGHLELYNTASDYRGLEVYKSDATKIIGLRFAEATNLSYLESLSGIPLYLNANGSSNRISLRVNDSEVVQVTSLGVGLGTAPQESLSVSSYQASRDTAIGIYAPNASSVMSVSKLTQQFASGNLVLSYGTAGAGTTNSFLMTSRSGTSAAFTSNGDFGINTTGPVFTGYTNARTITSRGGSGSSAGPGIFEMATNAADANGVMIGAITAVESSGTSRLSGSIEFYSSGSTANNRGSYVRIVGKTDGGGTFEVARTTNTGQFLVGAPNAFTAADVVRIHKQAGARITLTDANNACWLATVPVTTASELAIASNNAEAIRVDTLQRVGINTTAPQAKLDVGGPTTAGLAQAVFARGADINFTLGVRNGSNVNTDGEVLYQFGTEYTGVGTALTGGFKFIRGAQSANMQLDLYADSTRAVSYRGTSVTYLTQTVQASSMGRLSTQTNTTTAGLIMQPSASGVDGTDGAFITFRNKAGTKAFSLGMDLDGEFRVGGGSIGTTAYKVLHEGYNPGAMNNRGVVNWADADAYRATGTYQLQNSSNTASYGLIEFSDIGGSTTRVQLAAWYGGSDYASTPDELYFRTARDSQTNWDNSPILNNRIWHSGNLANPMTTSTSYSTPNATFLRAAGAPNVAGDTYWSTPAYGTNQGDNRTHFGYLYDVNNNIWHNYIRGNRTISEGLFATGPYPFIPGRAARYLATYSGTNSEYGITLNNLVDTGTAISFCTQGTQSAQGTTQGSITVTANAVQYNQTSDRRLKTNFKPAPSALEKIMDIDVMSYDFIKDGEHVEHGFVAQQLAQHSPEAVRQGNEGEIVEPEDVWQVDNSKLVPLLLKGQQELILRLAEAMNKIGELSKELEELKQFKR